MAASEDIEGEHARGGQLREDHPAVIYALRDSRGLERRHDLVGAEMSSGRSAPYVDAR